ncbi:MAG: glutathione S-transferase family protein [Deltaproteobacteria bacterium]|nr:glutathione S-transferase family protein [Deltaproteobacteria bacterium]
MMILNSWPVSPYSAKVRAYLRWKGAEFEDVPPSVFGLQRRIRKAVGKAIMPTVELPDGTWLQDSSEIIDTLEKSLPGEAITPPGPRQRVVSLLLELHGDEWLPMVALHYRWNVPANKQFAMSEFARFGVPWLPGFLGRALVKPVAEKMAGYLPVLGVDKRTIGGLESFTKQLLARLDAHFAEHDFVFGGRPAMADFALYGPLWAHLWRDVGSRSLFDALPNLSAWVERMLGPPTTLGPWLADDAIPATLEPILTTLLAEQGAYVERLVDAINAWCDANPEASRVPRSLGPTSVVIGGAAGTRKFVTESLWKVQRPLDAMTPETLRWVRTFGRLQWAPRHRVVRRDFKVVLDR